MIRLGLRAPLLLLLPLLLVACATGAPVTRAIVGLSARTRVFAERARFNLISLTSRSPGTRTATGLSSAM